MWRLVRMPRPKNPRLRGKVPPAFGIPSPDIGLVSSLGGPNRPSHIVVAGGRANITGLDQVSDPCVCECKPTETVWRAILANEMHQRHIVVMVEDMIGKGRDPAAPTLCTTLVALDDAAFAASVDAIIEAASERKNNIVLSCPDHDPRHIGHVIPLFVAWPRSPVSVLSSPTARSPDTVLSSPAARSILPVLSEFTARSPATVLSPCTARSGSSVLSPVAARS